MTQHLFPSGLNGSQSKAEQPGSSVQFLAQSVRDEVPSSALPPKPCVLMIGTHMGLEQAPRKNKRCEYIQITCNGKRLNPSPAGDYACVHNYDVCLAIYRKPSYRNS